MNKIQKTVLTVAMLSILAMPLVTLAVPTVGTDGRVVDINTVGNLITNIARFLIGIAMTVAVIFIVWGCIMWITARGDETKVKKAKAVVWQGILGALVILAVGVILSSLSNLVNNGAGLF